MNNILREGETARVIYQNEEYGAEVSFLSESSIKGFLYMEFASSGKHALVNENTIDRIIIQQ